jgi:hypothetical protein
LEFLKKNAGNTGKNKALEIPGKRGKLSPFHFRFTTSGSGDIISDDITAPHFSTSNDKWMVPPYYSHLYTLTDITNSAQNSRLLCFKKMY